MRNEQFYKIVIVLLLLLNGGTLVFLWMNNSKQQDTPPHMVPPHGRNPVDRMMSEKLALTQAQEELFRGLKDEHHRQMTEIQQEERQLHQDMFLLLKADNTDTTAKNAFMAKLELNDRIKEEVTFEHFRKLRLILTPEQKPKFDELMEEIASQILSQHRRQGSDGPPPPPPGRP